MLRPASEDLVRRRPVWRALSQLFLDADVSETLVGRAATLAAASYTMEELEEILVDEVWPVCSPNLRVVAGAWSGFDADWLETEILARLARRGRLARILNPGRIAVPRDADWRATRTEVERLRAMGHEGS